MLIALSAIQQLDLLQQRFPDGILIWAKQNGLIVSLKEQFDRLTNQGGFRLGHRIYNRALQQAGE